MKKSRIIVPGMAVIAFSTAAAIAGSVAWFTASRTVTISAGTYAVVKTTSNLEVKLFDGVGTTVSNADDNYSVTFGGKLTDASFNHTEGKIFKPNGNGTAIDASVISLADYDTTQAAKVTELATALERGKVTVNSVEKTVYSAATFDVEFTMNFGSTHETAKDVGLYLNNTAEKTSVTLNGSGELVTATGFRMAFYSTATGANKRVLADLQTAENCKYVASASNFVGTAYTNDLIDSAYNAALPTSETSRADATNRPDLLYVFEPAQDPVKVRFTVVAWFEGTDPNVVDQDALAKYQEVIANLVFEAVDLND